jgi:hypothetical protein
MISGNSTHAGSTFLDADIKDILQFNVSDESLADSYIPDSEFNNLFSSICCIDKGDIFRSNLKIVHIYSIPMFYVHGVCSEITLRSMLVSAHFIIPHSSLRSLLDNHFSYRI